MGLLFFEHGEAAQQWQAGVDEGGELAGEDREVFRLHVAAGFGGGCGFGLAFGFGFWRECGLGFFAGLAFFLNLGRVKPAAAQLLDGFALGAGGDGSGLLFAFGIEGAIKEVWHGVCYG